MCFSAHTYLNVLSEISGICVQYFAVSRMVLYTIGRHTTCWCSSTKKIDTTPISDVSRIHVKFWHYSRDPKIGVISFFLFSNTNRWYAALLHNLIHDWLRNMGVELPVFRILHANPCLHKTPPPKWDVFCVRTVLGEKYEILGVQRSYSDEICA